MTLAGRPRPVAGFSVLELMFAIIVAVLVYMIAIPAIGKARVSASVHNSRRVVVSTISLARATAIRYGRPAVLYFDSDGDRLWIEADTTVAGSGAAVDTVGLYRMADEFNVDLQSNRASICFDGRGLGTTGAECPVAGAVIVLSLKDRADTVNVTPLGRVVQ